MEIKNPNRKEFLQIRNSIDRDEHRANSSKICDLLFDFIADYYGYIDKILCFYPLGSEIDLLDLYGKLLKKGIHLYFPISNANDNTLSFYEIHDLKDDFEEGTFHVMEPIHKYMELLDFSNCICITPGLIFDKNCNRVGYGKGFYDRFFSVYRNIIKIGVCFEKQICDSLTPNATDIRLDIVFTENHIYRSLE